MSFHYQDIWRVFKTKGVNWLFDFKANGRFWFQWWTPIWHDDRGPYITIGIGVIRFMRGY